MQSRTRADALGTESLARLHRPAMEDPDRIRSVLERARDERVVLDNGIDGLIHSRGARIAWIADDRLGLDADYIDANRQPEIYFTFELDGRRYFFAATAIKAPVRDALEIGIPPVIYERECRDLPRTRPANSAGGPCRVELRATDGAKWTAEVLDQSYEGLGIALPAGTRLPKGGLSLVFLDGDRDGERAYAEVRHLQQSLSGTRIGLWVTQVPPVGPIPIERRPRILEEGLGGRMRRRLEVAGAAGRATMWRTLRRARRASESLPHVEVVEYPDDQGRPIRALVNRAGDPRGGTAVVVPPAWGRTKETLLPLAEILVRTFERAGEPVAVIRFDGTHRRGESHLEPGCRAPGDEYLNFRFSKSVRDYHATFDFLARAPELQSSKVVLVTTSLAAVEGRKAIATYKPGLVVGWVSLVGMVDLHSGLRSASGGIDYAFGLARSARKPAALVKELEEAAQRRRR